MTTAAMTRPCRIAGLGLAALLMSGASALAQTTERDQWRSYGQNPGSTNFSPLTQITPDNVATLKRAWTFNYGGGTDDNGDRGLDYRWEVTPLIIDGVMYVSTPTNPAKPDLKSTVTALEPETGKVLWKYASPRNIHGRGLAYWPGDGDVGPRLFFATDQGYLMALDMKTGQVAAGFGQDGLPEGLRGQRFRGLLSRVFIHRSVAHDIALRAVSGAPQLYCMGESAFGAYWPSVMSRTEVEEILNCSPPDFDAVRAEGHLLSAPGCRSAVATRHVMDFGASFISTREISRLTKLEVRGVDKEMKRLGHDRRCAGFWSRQDVSGPNGLLSSLRSNRRIFGVWDAAQFGLPIQACSGFRVDDAPEAEEIIRFGEKARLLFGTGSRINVSSAVERSA